MGKTNIQWTDEVWNCIRGCSRVSAGCMNCYAERTALRFAGKAMPYEGLVQISNGHPQWTGEVRVVDEKLWDPLRWTRPRRVFVNSMSDLFHEELPTYTLDDMFAVMALSPQHTFQCLTKRAKRMQQYMSEPGRGSAVIERMALIAFDEETKVGRSGRMPAMASWRKDMTDEAQASGESLIQIKDFVWPPKNVWLGVSVENQEAADERIPLLENTPAAVRWLSVEPMLEAIHLVWKGMPKIHWVVCGGESGPGARQFDVAWAGDLLVECKAVKIPFFMKQVGSNAIEYFNSAFGPADKKGGDPAEWPEWLRVREFPAMAGGVAQ